MSARLRSSGKKFDLVLLRALLVSGGKEGWVGAPSVAVALSNLGVDVDRSVVRARLSTLKEDVRYRTVRRARRFQLRGGAVKLLEEGARKKAGSSVITTPRPHVTAAIVEQALNDAQGFIASGNPTSGIDRVFTSLHGYLMEVCEVAHIDVPPYISVSALFKVIRNEHPLLQRLGPREGDIVKVLRAFSAVLDVLQPVRNRASLAHPNRALLDPDEARLVINATFTVLHYLDAKIGDGVGGGTSDKS